MRKNLERKKKEQTKEEQIGECPFAIPRYNLSLWTCIPNIKFLSLTVVEISLTKNLERKKKGQTQGRTNRRMPLCNPTIQLVVVDLYTKYEVSILNGCGDIFDKKVLRNYGRTDGRTDGTTDRCKPVYPPLFQSGGIIKGMPQRGQIFSCKCTTSHALGAQCNQWNVDYHIHPTLFCSGFKLCRTIFEN